MQKHHSGLQIYQKQWDRAVVQKRTWTRWRWLARAESRAAAARSTAEHFFLRQLLLCCSPPQRSRHPQRSRSRHPQPHPAAAAAAMPLVDAHPTPLMRIEDVLGKEAANLPLRVAKSLGDIKTMPMPYDLLPPEMRAKDVHERHERRKKMALHTVNSTSLLHWTWEPTMSNLEISTEATQRKPRREKRRSKKEKTAGSLPSVCSWQLLLIIALQLPQQRAGSQGAPRPGNLTECMNWYDDMGFGACSTLFTMGYSCDSFAPGTEFEACACSSLSFLSPTPAAARRCGTEAVLPH